MNTTHALDVAGKLGIPAFMALFQPLLPTREHAYIAGIGPKLPKVFDPLTYAVLSVQQTYYDLPRYLLRPALGYFPLFRTGFAKAPHNGPCADLARLSRSCGAASARLAGQRLS